MKKWVMGLIFLFVFAMFGFCIVRYCNDSRIQKNIDMQFMSDYENLIQGMLNRSIQTDEAVIHKYDTENTKYGFRLTEFYPYSSYVKHKKFNEIVQLLDQSSGCDAYYEIDMNKELYDRLNELGHSIFREPQGYTDEMLERTWEVLCNAVDFGVK